MIGAFLFGRGREARAGLFRAAHGIFPESTGDETALSRALCEALCAPGGYLRARVVETRPDGGVRPVASAGASREPGAAPAPGLSASLPFPVDGGVRMTLVVEGASKALFGPGELADLSALASRLGEAITGRRLASRFESLRKVCDDRAASLRSERDFSTLLLDLVPLPIVQVGPEGEIRTFNRRCESLTGQRASEMLNRRMPDLLIPEPLRSDFRRLLVELFIGRRHGGAAFPILTRSGESVAVDWTFAPIREGEGGRVASILACGKETNVSNTS